MMWLLFSRLLSLASSVAAFTVCVDPQMPGDSDSDSASSTSDSELVSDHEDLRVRFLSSVCSAWFAANSSH